MKKVLITSLALAMLCLPARGAELAKYQPGNRLIDGSQLNKMVDVVNGLTGNGGTVSTGYFSLNTTGTTGPTALSGTVLQVVGANSATARIELDSYAGPAIFTTRRFDGTKTSPTALLSGDQIGSFNFNGSSTTALTYGPASRFTSYATENWSSTAGGTRVVISTTPNTTQTLTDAATFGQDQSLTLVGAFNSPKHFNTGATPPVLTSCGGGSPAITGSDTAGIVTMGTSATGCVITFAVAYTGTPYCVVSWIATPLASQSYVTSNTAITLTQTSASGNKVQYVCAGPSGG